mmetsp:Transcript_46759/g.133638  ORF Transcript_46759/g.133638 Transcript_46759/m.133638 type:complete len:100 (-) Transcript_46759:437-736(-)
MLLQLALHIFVRGRQGLEVQGPMLGPALLSPLGAPPAPVMPSVVVPLVAAATVLFPAVGMLVIPAAAMLGASSKLVPKSAQASLSLHLRVRDHGLHLYL